MKLFLIPGLAVAMQITAFAQTNSKCCGRRNIQESWHDS
jgi:hypothetical protein